MICFQEIPPDGDNQRQAEQLSLYCADIREASQLKQHVSETHTLLQAAATNIPLA